MSFTNRLVKETILLIVLAWACSKPASSQAVKTAPNESSEGGSQSSAELAKQASNPLSSAWLLQIQQNNNWVGMPLNHGDRVESDLLFQPLVSAKLTDQWTLLARPILTVFNTAPYVGSGSVDDRTTGFGDMVLAFALSPRPMLKGHLTVAAGPTFIFPTASNDLLGQRTWQLGPDVGVVISGGHFLAFAFPQQWFKIGGDGEKTSQLSTIWGYTHFFKNGWNVGTEPNLSVDWQAVRSQRVSFPIGPQVGKMCKCGHTPTLIQLQLDYYAVHPTNNGPKWNVQLQITPTIPSLIKKKIF